MKPSINGTFLSLIPKVDHHVLISQCKPISRCNVVYKLVTKVLTNRLKKVLPNIVSPRQSSFVSGRHITNILLLLNKWFIPCD